LREKDQAEEGTELGISPPSAYDSLEESDQGGEELDHGLNTSECVEDGWTVPSYTLRGVANEAYSPECVEKLFGKST
jgi:hypothetical protein